MDETSCVRRASGPTRNAPRRRSTEFRLAFGGANTFSTCALGAFPILFGLSFWQGLAATVLGVVLGALVRCPMAIFGPINGTNNAVSSSAHLGVHGRIVGSFLSLLTAVAFFSLAVWGSGDALVGGVHRLFGLPRSTFSYTSRGSSSGRWAISPVAWT